MKEINLKELQDLISGKETFILDFFADWCMPCRAIAPVLEALETQYNINVYKINIDTGDISQLQEMYEFQSIPCVITHKDGIAYEVLTGGLSKDHYINAIKKII